MKKKISKKKITMGQKISMGLHNINKPTPVAINYIINTIIVLVVPLTIIYFTHFNHDEALRAKVTEYTVGIVSALKLFSTFLANDGNVTEQQIQDAKNEIDGNKDNQ